MPIVLVDMDGPLADFDAEVLSRLRTKYPDMTLLSTRKHFYISDDYPQHSQLVRSISDEQGFFESLPLAADALYGWQRIIDLGYHPRICSAPMKSNPFSMTEKINWLKREFVPIFGKYVVEEAIISSDKHLHDGIVLIDDRSELIGSKQATWKHIVFDAEYNHDSKQPRLYGWSDKNLPNLLKSANK